MSLSVKIADAALAVMREHRDPNNVAQAEAVKNFERLRDLNARRADLRTQALLALDANDLETAQSLMDRIEPLDAERVELLARMRMLTAGATLGTGTRN